MKPIFLSFVIVVFQLSAYCAGQGTRFDEEVALYHHNRYRSLQNATNMLRMTWDQDLAEETLNYAEQCLFNHDQNRGAVGENIYVTSRALEESTMASAISSWYNEIEHYDYDNHACSDVCGHYTQVVWAESYQLGCAAVSCPDGVTGYPPGRSLVFCRYRPAGNLIGQRPFRKGEVCSECTNSCVDNLCTDEVETTDAISSTTTSLPPPPTTSSAIWSTTPQNNPTTVEPTMASTSTMQSISTTTTEDVPQSTDPTMQTTTASRPPPTPTDEPINPTERSCSHLYQKALKNYRDLMEDWKEAYEAWTERAFCDGKP